MKRLFRAAMVVVDEPFQGLAPALVRQYAESLSRMFRLQPRLRTVITESNRSLLDRVQCTTLSLESGELTAEDPNEPGVTDLPRESLEVPAREEVEQAVAPALPVFIW
jgi:ABC-type branched-subunit amino acid transport system ATPase component